MVTNNDESKVDKSRGRAWVVGMIVWGWMARVGSLARAISLYYCVTLKLSDAMDKADIHRWMFGTRVLAVLALMLDIVGWRECVVTRGHHKIHHVILVTCRSVHQTKT